MAAELSWLPFLLQTADALFPTGAYAHSLGFEEAVRLGTIRDERTLGDFLQSHVAPAMERQELPYLRFAATAAQAGNLQDLCVLDAEISAWKLARETREASIQLGVRRLKALSVISSNPLLEAFGNCITTEKARGHHLTVCGLQAAVENIPLEAALATYFYQSLAAVCGASLKLIRIGQDACQRALRASCTNIENLIQRSLLISRGDAGWFNPLLEIASMRHERADERLFIS